MSQKLSGEIALVTGASKGIGASIAKALTAAGATVLVNYSTSKEGAERVVAEIGRMGGKAVAIQGDVSKPEGVRKLFDETKKNFDGLDILVNNAGVYRFAPIDVVTEEEFHREFNTNVLGLLLCTQEAVKLFGDKGGNVINITSVATHLTPPNSAVYSGTKGGVTRSPTSLPRSWPPEKFASTRSPPVESKPKVRTRVESAEATSKNRS